MAPHNEKNFQLRQRIAHQAARLMAEQGIDDFQRAKHKAARQLGASHQGGLPGNAEIESALHCYHNLYHISDHSQQLARLRRGALAAMERLTSFRPHLVGPAAKGIVGELSEITLILYAEPAEAPEELFAAQSINAQLSERRLHLASGIYKSCPVYHYVEQGIPVEVVLLPPGHVSNPPLDPANGKAMKGLNITALKHLMDAEAKA